MDIWSEEPLILMQIFTEDINSTEFVLYESSSTLSTRSNNTTVWSHNSACTVLYIHIKNLWSHILLAKKNKIKFRSQKSILMHHHQFCCFCNDNFFSLLSNIISMVFFSALINLDFFVCVLFILPSLYWALYTLLLCKLITPGS